MHFLKVHVEEGFLQNNEKRTGDARSHSKPLLQNTLAWHSSRTIVWTLLRDTLVAYSTLVGHSCGTLLRDTLVKHSCGTLLLDTLVAHSGKTHSLSLNTLKHSCKTLLLDTLAWHIWSASQYYFVLQSVHAVNHSTTFYCKSCIE